MSDTLYTTTEKIRAALGVSDKELSETLMVDLQLTLQLEIELDQLVATHATIFSEGTTGTPSSEQVKKWKQLQLLTQYQGALICLDNSQLWSAQRISDGDADMQRFAKDDLDTMRINITNRRDFYAGLLNPALADTAASYNALSVADPSYDPVTNEGA